MVGLIRYILCSKKKFQLVKIFVFLKICIQCIHQISRCHAFKTKVEKADSQLRQYIKGLTVVVEHVPKTIPINQMEIPRDKLHQLNRLQIQNVSKVTTIYNLKVL